MRPLIAVSLLAVVASPALAAPPSTPAAVMKRATALYVQDTQGVMGYMNVADTQLRSNLFNKNGSSRTWVVAKDGRPARARVLEVITDGKPDETERQKTEARTDEAFRKGTNHFAAPYEPGSTDDYTLAWAPKEPHGPGEVAIAFTSLKKDERHGSGVLVVTKEGRVKRLRYTPSVLPARVTHGEVSIERGEVAPGMWGPVRMSLTFKGSAGPMSGTFTLNQRYEKFRRFSSLEAALAATPKR